MNSLYRDEAQVGLLNSKGPESELKHADTPNEISKNIGITMPFEVTRKEVHVLHRTYTMKSKKFKFCANVIDWLIASLVLFCSKWSL